jgi:hypothetical protein
MKGLAANWGSDFIFEIKSGTSVSREYNFDSSGLFTTFLQPE